LRPSAKINLTLRVGPTRADGFHDVQTLLQSIDVADTLTLAPRSGPLRLVVRGHGAPVDHANLVWRAAAALWRAIGRPGDPRDVHITLEKFIPVAAGLGGGSADAAAALAGLNRIWGAKLTLSALVDIAASLGSDVPFFLQGGTALGTGRGEEVYPVDDVKRLAVVVIKPAFAVATADAYRWFDEDRGSGEPASRPRAIDLGWPARPVALVNDLQDSVARRHPGVSQAFDACLAAGALGAAMTGSGSAVFGLFAPGSARAAARRLARPDWLVLLARTLSRAEAARRGGL
jgi:4-diphosphocytidyl-2-C-methyl-D-erythritol kinase